jgi:H+/Cl- antiporter ClcA
MGTNTPRPSVGSSVALALVSGIIVVVLGSLLYFEQPAYGHFYGLLDLGILALVVGLLLYLFQVFTHYTRELRIASTAAFWFGVAVLLAADLLTPDSAFGGSASSFSFGFDRSLFLIVVLFLALLGILILQFRERGAKYAQRRVDERAAWRQAAGIPAPPPNPAAPTLPAPQTQEPANAPGGR